MDSREISLTPEVIDAIDEELAYHTNLVANGRTDEEDHGVTGQLIALEVYIRKAQEAWNNNPGNDLALNQIRKVAAAACRALIKYGCPKRSEERRIDTGICGVCKKVLYLCRCLE